MEKRLVVFCWWNFKPFAEKFLLSRTKMILVTFLIVQNGHQKEVKNRKISQHHFSSHHLIPLAFQRRTWAHNSHPFNGLYPTLCIIQRMENIPPFSDSLIIQLWILKDWEIRKIFAIFHVKTILCNGFKISRCKSCLQ